MTTRADQHDSSQSWRCKALMMQPLATQGRRGCLHEDGWLTKTIRMRKREACTGGIWPGMPPLWRLRLVWGFSMRERRLLRPRQRQWVWRCRSKVGLAGRRPAIVLRVAAGSAELRLPAIARRWWSIARLLRRPWPGLVRSGTVPRHLRCLVDRVHLVPRLLQEGLRMARHLPRLHLWRIPGSGRQVVPGRLLMTQLGHRQVVSVLPRCVLRRCVLRRDDSCVVLLRGHSQWHLLTRGWVAGLRPSKTSRCLHVVVRHRHWLVPQRTRSAGSYAIVHGRRGARRVPHFQRAAAVNMPGWGSSGRVTCVLGRGGGGAQARRLRGSAAIRVVVLDRAIPHIGSSGRRRICAWASTRVPL